MRVPPGHIRSICSTGALMAAMLLQKKWSGFISVRPRYSTVKHPALSADMTPSGALSIATHSSGGVCAGR